jgi:Sulfotransferase family
VDVFVHIPKSSGSTIRAILSRQYGVDHILYFEPSSPRWNTSTSAQDFLIENVKKRNIELITGHHSYGIHNILREPCRNFTIIRNPIKRLLSDYYYAFSYEHHRYRDEIRSGRITVEQFLTDPQFGVRNAQSKMLAGRWQSRNGEAKAAIETAQHSFVAVGTTERFDESILYMAKVLGWKPPIFVNKNVTKLDSSIDAERKQIEATARKSFAQIFASEFEVYEAVDALLSEWILSEGHAFVRALEAFREMQSDITAHSSKEIYDLYEFAENDRLPPFAERFIGSEPYRQLSEYLGEPPKRIPPASNYVGNIDRMDDDLIAGWALDLHREAPIDVTVYRSGVQIARTAANLPREDILRSGYRHLNAGFRLKLPQPIVNPREYAVCFEGTSLCV